MKIRNHKSAYSMVTKYKRKNGKVYTYTQDQIDAINNGADIDKLEPVLYKKPSTKSVNISQPKKLTYAEQQARLDFEKSQNAEVLVTAYNSNYVTGFNSFV